MNLALSRNGLVMLSFLLLASGASAYGIAATVNYLQFWPGLNSLSVEVTRMSLAGGLTPGPAKLTMTIQVDNPSGYTGFKISDYDVSLYFFVSDNRSLSLFYGAGFPFDQTVGSPIGPRSQLSSAVLVPLSNDNATALSKFNQTYYPRILTYVYLQVGIITFLDAYSGHKLLTFVQDVPLSLG